MVSYKTLAALVLGTAALLSWAAIEFVPETLYFPEVEYSMPGELHFAMLKTGEPDLDRCRQTARQLAGSVHSLCPACQYADRCTRGLSREARRILSREPLDTPSVRTPGNGVTMTISAADPALASSICRLIEQQSAAQPAEKRARCYAAFAQR